MWRFRISSTMRNLESHTSLVNVMKSAEYKIYGDLPKLIASGSLLVAMLAAVTLMKIRRLLVWSEKRRRYYLLNRSYNRFTTASQ